MILEKRGLTSHEDGVLWCLLSAILDWYVPHAPLCSLIQLISAFTWKQRREENDCSWTINKKATQNNYYIQHYHVHDKTPRMPNSISNCTKQRLWNLNIIMANSDPNKRVNCLVFYFREYDNVKILSDFYHV